MALYLRELMAGKKRLGEPAELDLFSIAAQPEVAVLTTSTTVTTTTEEVYLTDDPEINLEPPLGPQIYSVTEISGELKSTLSDRFGEIMIQGEIADFKGIHRSGHLYFALKDEKSQIKAVMWRGSVVRVPFEIKGGLEVIVTGRLDYYGGQGSLQFVVEKMEPVGIGALQLKFEQLKEKLKSEGLFDLSRKRKVKLLNWRIGIVTGRSTAALQDMLKIFSTRFPLAELYLFHASVQGEKAPSEICEAIRVANAYSEKAEKPLEVLIIGRGGGSYEDLFCFNDEALARAIAASKIPTVSAVGHEIDFTIADLVADKRAATPSHAAQETVPEAQTWFDRLEELSKNFERQMLDAIRDLQQKIDLLYNRIAGSAPQKKLESQKELLSQYQKRLEQLIKNTLERRNSQVARLASVLDALSPLKVLDRGYSIVADLKGKAVRSVKDVKSGDELKLRLTDGEISTLVI